MPLPFTLELAVFVIGLLFGSFLNVCISRLPLHRSLARPRSHCPSCGHTIRWYDNVPLLSWILLRGHCRDCGHAISWRYPAVELATAGWFTLVAFLASRAASEAAGPLSASAFTLILLSALNLIVLGFLLLGLMVMDWESHTLPDTFTLSGALLGFLFVCTQAIFLPYGAGDIKLNPRHSLRMSSPGSFAAKGNVFLTGTEGMVFGRVAAIAGAVLLLLAIRWIYYGLRGRKHRVLSSPAERADARYGMGLGDVKLLAMIAAFLGFWHAMLALFVGVLLCTAFALMLLARRTASGLTQLPLGSFLALGGLLAALLGDAGLTWYRSLF